jgi:hypothetical protein
MIKEAIHHIQNTTTLSLRKQQQQLNVASRVVHKREKVCLKIQGRDVVVSVTTIIGPALTQRLIPQIDPHTIQTSGSKVHVLLLPYEEPISVDADNLGFDPVLEGIDPARVASNGSDFQDVSEAEQSAIISVEQSHGFCLCSFRAFDRKQMLFQKIGHSIGALGSPQHRLRVKEDNNVVHNFRAETRQKH